MPLTATAAKQAKAKEKSYKLFDEKGMFLLINPNGSKYWRLKYRFGGKEKLLALAACRTCVRQAPFSLVAVAKHISWPLTHSLTANSASQAPTSTLVGHLKGKQSSRRCHSQHIHALHIPRQGR